MHSALLRHVETHRVQNQFGEFFDARLEKGVYKTHSNNPMRPDGSIHEYCPPEQVASEMDRLVALYNEHAKRVIPPEIEAAWLHHAFTQIHPFADGNGRLGRMLASLVFIRAGSFPLVVTRDHRTNYIDRLEKADRGGLSEFVKFVVRTQRRDLLKGIDAIPTKPNRELSTGAPRGSSEREVAAVREMLAENGTLKIGPKSWNTAVEIGERLYRSSHGSIENLRQLLSREIGGQFGGESGRLSGDREVRVRDGCRKFLYEPNFEKWNFYQTVELGLGREVLVTSHAVGVHFRGVIASVVFLNDNGNLISAVEDSFQTNYKDRLAAVEARFAIWLEDGLARALALWRERL
jgi:prophage maintenance system killer protein